jgi:hypothetical protein
VWRATGPRLLVWLVAQPAARHRHARICDRPQGRLPPLGDPPGLSPITTVGRYDTVEAAQVATDDVWAARCSP